MKHGKLILLLLFITLTLSAILHLFHYYDIFSVPTGLRIISRWLILAVIFYYAYRKRSLTIWIMLSMLMGAEFGEDFPSVAIHLNVISKIFLNLIKTIIAPLLFGTLVVGIAGHSNLKQVGRMGWKSILYFEIVSTIALFIGLLAHQYQQGRSRSDGSCCNVAGHCLKCQSRPGIRSSFMFFLKILQNPLPKDRSCRSLCSVSFWYCGCIGKRKVP